MMTNRYRQRLFSLLALLLAALLTIPPAGVRAQDGGAGPVGDVPPPPAALDPGQPVDENWWAEAQAAIQAEEYEITWQEGLALAEASCSLPGA